jgi:hypothetical protein
MERTDYGGLRRKLTGEESIFFRTPDANVSLVAPFKGEVDEGKLKFALTCVAEPHPLSVTLTIAETSSSPLTGPRNFH